MLKTVKLFYSALSNCGKRFKHGGLLLGVAVGLICHWIPAHGGPRTSKYYREKYERSTVYFNLKETSLKRINKCKIHWQVECHHQLKEKISLKMSCMRLEHGPLDYEETVLPIELSYQMIFR